MAAASALLPPASFGRPNSVQLSSSFPGQPSSLRNPSSATSLSFAVKTTAKDTITAHVEKEKEEIAELAWRWRELAGSNNWAGLLDPIDPHLRSELIRYGEFAQACYDAFDFDRFSRYCGGCKYHNRSFFESLGMADVGYHVTRYLYASSVVNLPRFFRRSKKDDSWSDAANWLGYVAVSDDATSARLGRRDVAVSWRGTVTKLEWIADLMNFQHPVTALGIPCPDPSVKVLAGFVDLYTAKNVDCRFSKYSAREQIIAEIWRLVERYPIERGEDVSISFTGHSLGGALATLSAYDVAELGLHRVNEEKVLPLTVYSFAGPRVGNERFTERFERALGVKSLRVVNVHDVVPKVPGVVINEKTPELLRRASGAIPWCYSHVGEKLTLDHEKSPFLKEAADPACAHNLEAYLHLLDG